MTKRYIKRVSTVPVNYTTIFSSREYWYRPLNAITLHSDTTHCFVEEFVITGTDRQRGLFSSPTKHKTSSSTNKSSRKEPTTTCRGCFLVGWLVLLLRVAHNHKQANLYAYPFALLHKARGRGLDIERSRKREKDKASWTVFCLICWKPIVLVIRP